MAGTGARDVVWRTVQGQYPSSAATSLLEHSGTEGDTPVVAQSRVRSEPNTKEDGPGESGCLRVQPKAGGILHLRLNKNGRPIANKYRKGKMQRTLKREFKELEVVEREAIVGTT